MYVLLASYTLSRDGGKRVVLGLLSPLRRLRNLQVRTIVRLARTSTPLAGEEAAWAEGDVFGPSDEKGEF